MQHPWAITEQAFEALMEMARLYQSSGFAGLKAAWDDEMGGGEQEAKPAGSIGVIPIRGTIKQHSSNSFFDFLFGGTSIDGLSRQFNAFLDDPNVKAIVFDIDSPGGSTYGATEFANEILAARGTKPIVAVANSVAASLAYWVGATADKFYVTPGGLVGSIGVFMVHEDISKMAEDLGVKVTMVAAGKHKLRGNEFEALSDEDVAHYQGLVNETYDRFVKDVARGRGVTAAAVRGGFGEGDVVTAGQAQKLGMVDGVMTLGAAIEKAQTLKAKAPAGPAAEAAVVETSDEPLADEEGATRLRRLKWQAQSALAGAFGGPSGDTG